MPALIERAYLRRWLINSMKPLPTRARPSRWTAHLRVCRARRLRVQQEDYDKALGDFQKAIDLGSQAAVIYIARGMILLHKHDPNRAFAELKRAQEIDPRHPDVRRDGLDVHDAGENDKALKVLDQAVAIDPQCGRFSWQSGGRFSGDGQVRQGA